MDWALISGAKQWYKRRQAETIPRKFHLKMRKNFLTVQVTEHWDRLSREGVGPPSLGMSQNHLDTIL